MAQLRCAIAVVTQDTPAQVLAHLDAAARTLQLEAMATVVVARIEQLVMSRRWRRLLGRPIAPGR